MLQSMRSGAKSVLVKVVLFGLLLMATLGLAVMDIHSMFSGRSMRGHVAELDGQKITVPEFDRLVQSQARARNMTAEEAYMQGLPQQLLQQEVNMRLFARAVYDMGLRVDDKTAAGEIRRQLKPLVKKPGDEKAVLQQALTNMGMTEKQFVRTLKNQMAGDMLMKSITNNVSVPDLLVREALKLSSEKRSASYFAIRADNIGKVGEPDDTQLAAAYEDMKKDFMTPELRGLSVMVVDKKSLNIKPGAATEADAKAYYESNESEFMAPERRTLSQTIVTDEETAQKVADAVNAGQSVKDAAQKLAGGKATVLSKDYDASGLPEELSAPVFKAAKGDVIGPVKTAFGWHVLTVDGIKAPGQLSFDSVKADIIAKLKQDGGASALFDKANDIDSALSGGKSLEDVAATYGLTVKKIAPVDAKGMTPAGVKALADVPGADKILSNAFALEQGETSQLIEVPAGFVVVSVASITPAEPKPLAAVKAEVVRRWKQAEANKLIQKKSKELTEAIAKGASFESLAKEANKKPVEIAPMRRTDSADKTGLPRGLDAVLFTMDKIGQILVVPTDGELVVMTMTGRRVDDAVTAKDEEIKKMKTALARSQENDLLDQFGLYLADKYKAKLYPEVLDQLYAPKGE